MSAHSTSLEQLNSLLDEGKITPAEYEELRSALRSPRSQTAPQATRRRLAKSWANRQLGGVCAGIGEYFDIDPLIIRILAVAGVFVLGPVLLLLYLVMYFAMPWDDLEAVRSTETRGRPVVFGAALLALWLLEIVAIGGLIVPRLISIWTELGAALPPLAILVVRLHHTLTLILGLMLLVVAWTIYRAIHRPGLRAAYSVLVLGTWGMWILFEFVVLGWTWFSVF